MLGEGSRREHFTSHGAALGSLPCLSRDGRPRLVTGATPAQDDILECRANIAHALYRDAGVRRSCLTQEHPLSRTAVILEYAAPASNTSTL